VQRLGLANIERYERELLAYATQRLLAVPGLTIVGTAAEKASVLSLVIAGVDTTALGAALNQYGIAVRAGHTLRAADRAALRLRGDAARLARPLQYPRGNPRPARGGC